MAPGPSLLPCLLKRRLLGSWRPGGVGSAALWQGSRGKCLRAPPGLCRQVWPAGLPAGLHRRPLSVRSVASAPLRPPSQRTLLGTLLSPSLSSNSRLMSQPGPLAGPGPPLSRPTSRSPLSILRASGSLSLCPSPSHPVSFPPAGRGGSPGSPRVVSAFPLGC